MEILMRVSGKSVGKVKTFGSVYADNSSIWAGVAAVCVEMGGKIPTGQSLPVEIEIDGEVNSFLANIWGVRPDDSNSDTHFSLTMKSPVTKTLPKLPTSPAPDRT